MKGFRIAAIFLAFVLLSPIFTSLLEVDNTLDYFELTEKSKDNEQKEKSESDAKDELDEVGKFLLLNQDNETLLSCESSKYFNNKIGISNFNIDVLTPPPEFI